MNIVSHTFQNKINGLLGDFWKKDALREIERVRQDIIDGEIIFDENGVAYNCIGRVLMDDLAEVVEYITDRINRKATAKAREDEVARFVEEYRKNPPKMTEEDYAEMRAAFGPDVEIVDVISGQKYRI